VTFATNFKPARVSEATRRRAKHARLKREEMVNKQEVRDRDVLCRFPRCTCFHKNLRLDVSHSEHKGMGGDPTGERSAPELMVLLCHERHMNARISVDKKTLRWIPLTDDGAKGPIAWEVNVGRLSGGALADEWIELARESSRGNLMPLNSRQEAMLTRLGQELLQAYR
jgi:hypothetical protein